MAEEEKTPRGGGGGGHGHAGSKLAGKGRDQEAKLPQPRQSLHSLHFVQPHDAGTALPRRSVRSVACLQSERTAMAGLCNGIASSCSPRWLRPCR